MKKHHVSHADELFFGEGVTAQDVNGRQGVPFTPITKVILGTPAALDADGIAAAQAVAGAADLTLDGALISGGVLTNATPRGVQAVSSSASDTTKTLTFYGTDVYNRALVERITLNGTNAVAGKKAFKTVTRVAVSAACVGNVSAGTTDVLGLPYRLTEKSDLMQTWFNNVLEATVPTVVVGDATTATATTGDVRGTIDLNSACDGSRVAVYMAAYPSSEVALFGVAQYGG